MARRWHAAKCCVHPAKSDGSKLPVNIDGCAAAVYPAVYPDTYSSGPNVGRPHPYAGKPHPKAGRHRAGWKLISTGTVEVAWSLVDRMLRGAVDGIGIMCGAVSGNLEMVELEGRAAHLVAAIEQAAADRGISELWHRFNEGCSEWTPSGGIHWFARTPDAPTLPNTKLALRPNPEDPRKPLCFAETRGEGGWVVVAGSFGRTHKSGLPYVMRSGSPAAIPTLTADERDAIHALFRTLDEMPEHTTPPGERATVARRERPAGELRPGDDFNERGSWSEVLPSGWARLSRDERADAWSMHGQGGRKTADHYHDSDTLYIYDSDCSGSGRRLDKFAAYAWLNHSGDFHAAASALYAAGYGSRWEKTNQPSDGEGDDDNGADVELMPDLGPVRNLDEWRREGLERKVAAMSKPGIYLDRGGVGTGKTKSMIDAIGGTGQTSVLWITPDHANCQERVAELRTGGVDAVAYPRLDEKSCRNIEAVKAAQAFGLVAGAAVCPSCPFRDACIAEGYLSQKDRADRSARRVATTSRAQCSDAIFEARKRPAPEVIVIDERGGDLLAETIRTTMPDLKMAKHFLANVEAAGRRVGRKNEAFARSLIAVIEVIEKASDGVRKDSESAAKTASKNAAAGAVHRVELPPKQEMPKRWQAVFNEWVQTFRTSLNGDRLGDGFAAGIRLITLAAAGGLHEMWVMGERKIVTVKGKRVATTHIEVMGKRMADLPKSAKVFVLDADATVEQLTARTGKQITDITPAGHIPVVQKVRQVPIDVTKGADAGTTARIIEAHLHADPNVRRLGVIGHKKAIDEIFEDSGGDYLQPWDRDRVAMTAGFGTGPDRGSNLWTVACDDLAVIGTPRPPVIRSWLLAHGEIEAASIPEPEWGEYLWEGMTTDGRRKVFKALGYLHPAWRRAARAVVLSAILQPAGRGRAILPTGISVTVYTDQPTGFPVDESIEAALPSVHDAVDAVAYLIEREREREREEGRDRNAQNGLDISLGDFAHFPIRSTAVVEHLMIVHNIGRRAAQVKIDLAVAAGRLERLPGWLLRLRAPSQPSTAAEAPGGHPEAQPAALPVSAPPEIAAAPARPALVVRAAQPELADQPLVVVAPLLVEASTVTCTATSWSPPASPRGLPQLPEAAALDPPQKSTIRAFPGLDSAPVCPLNPTPEDEICAASMLKTA